MIDSTTVNVRISRF